MEVPSPLNKGNINSKTLEIIFWVIISTLCAFLVFSLTHLYSNCPIPLELFASTVPPLYPILAAQLLEMRECVLFISYSPDWAKCLLQSCKCLMHFCRMSALHYLVNQLVLANYKKTSHVSLFYLYRQEMVILFQLPWPESFQETKEKNLIYLKSP